jgi:hypothetical protein
MGVVLVVIYTEREGAIRIIGCLRLQLPKVEYMKRKNFNHMSEQNHSDFMLPEYYFKNMAGGVRGKYFKAYRAGHTVKIHQEDGSTEVRHFSLLEIG